MTLDIRSITRDGDGYDAVTRLRYAVYAEEEGLEIEGMDHDRRSLADALDAASIIIGAFDGARAVGTIRITPVGAFPASSKLCEAFETDRFPGTGPQQVLVGRLIVDKGHRGSAITMKLFAAATVAAANAGVRVAFLESSPRHVPLYESIGCKSYTRCASDRSYGLTVPMVFFVGDTAGLDRHQYSRMFVAGNPPRSGRSIDPELPGPGRACSVRGLPPGEAQRLMMEIDRLGVELLDGANRVAGERLLRASALLELDAGQTVLHRGNRGTEIYLVLGGSVLLAPADASATILAPAGQFFAQQSPRWATPAAFDANAIALQPTTLLSISAEALQSIRVAQPEPASRLAEIIDRHRARSRPLSEGEAREPCVWQAA